MKKKKLFILFLTILIFTSLVNPVFARHYIGDEDPTNFALGEGESPEQAIERNKSILPGLFPKEDNLLQELNWIKYPFENYFFKTASSKDKGFFQNKIEDVGAVVTDLFATVFLIFAIGFSTLGNNIILVCFHDYWGKGIYDFIGNMAGMFVSGLQGNNIVGLLFIIALIILGITIASYLLRAQVMKAFTAILTSAICIGLFLGYLTIVSSILPGVISFVNNFSGAALVATHYLKEAPMDPNKPAPTPPAKLGPVTDDPLTSGLIETTNACWQATLAGPWATAQFGYSNPNKLKLSDKEIEQINKDNNAWWKWKGLIPDVDMGKLLPGRKENLPNPSYMDTVWLASGSGAREVILDAISNPSLKESNDRRTYATTGCGQSSATYHLITSLIMLPAAALFFLFALLVGIPVFVAQFVLIILIIIMPLALLLGASGDKGINLLRKYISALLGCLATKIIYGFYLGLILFFAVAMTNFPDVQDNAGLLAFLVAIIFAAGIKFRKPFYNQVVALLSFSPETTGEKAGNWVGTTAKALTAGYILKTIKGNNNDQSGGDSGGDNTGGTNTSGGRDNNPDPPPNNGNGGNNNNNNNDANAKPPPNDNNDNNTNPEPPPGGDTGDGDGSNTGGGGGNTNPEPPPGGGNIGGSNNSNPPPGSGPDNNTGGINSGNTDNPEPPSHHEDDSGQIPYDRNYDFSSYDFEPDWNLDDNTTLQNPDHQFDAPTSNEQNVVDNSQWDREMDNEKHNDTEKTSPMIQSSPQINQTKSHDIEDNSTTNRQNFSPQPDVQHNNESDKKSDTRIETTKQIHHNTRKNAQDFNNQPVSDSQDQYEPELIEPPTTENNNENQE